ncbi:DUF4044 domain-containing protein [Companilactobacillus mishanensis]|uniref:DUF4044 domain-containing protein n=1 Tax=Companilactobacillus mishanensis TaxID=2486008 RepID=A0A5P0ZGR2_9LACO|nr:DUF4044 domain-containing protein [Companilactobacillus mishanensis]MQS44044.1 DUF4044 domain-containing protein [Companilactobacillus mishanensis]MQS52253.1 DUF4044 domain-containing protein [Companilactobacillus mishanensis]MQS88343.1 DUF4044 domain-containing protein [Companilactobacillus mishanensis]
MDDKKPKSTLSKIIQVVVWLMIIVTIGGVLLTAAMSFL